MPTVLIQCNRCQVATRQGSPGETANELRARLTTVGWLCRKTADQVEIDICPGCRTK